MAGPYAFARPFTATLRTETDVQFSELTKALMNQYGMKSIACCQPTSPGVFQVTFTSTQSYTAAISQGCKLRNSIVTFEPVHGAPTTVTIRNAPFEMPADQITTALRSYGKITHHAYEYPDPDLPATNGTRRIRMNMDSPIPNFVRIGAYQVMVLYPGVKKVCRKCSMEGHMGRDCTSYYCQPCRAWKNSSGCHHSNNTGTMDGKQGSLQMPDVVEAEYQEEPMTTIATQDNMEQQSLWTEVFKSGPQEATANVLPLSVNAHNVDPATGCAESLATGCSANSATGSSDRPAAGCAESLHKSFARTVGDQAVFKKPEAPEPERTTASKKLTQASYPSQKVKRSHSRSPTRVLQPPIMTTQTPYVPVLTPLVARSLAGGGMMDVGEEALKRSLSQSSLSSSTTLSAGSDTSDTDRSGTGTLTVNKKKKKKDAVTVSNTCLQCQKTNYIFNGASSYTFTRSDLKCPRTTQYQETN